jgi:uncharacterized protein (DUF983 family)
MTAPPSESASPSTSAPPLMTLLLRGARKRCPQCGEGRLFKRLNIMHEHCAVCGLKYLEDQGDLFGYLFVLDRAIFILPLIAMVFLRLYVPSSSWFYVLWVVLMVALVFTLPQRTGMSIAIDYMFRRRRSGKPL